MSLDKVMLFICITGIIAAAIGCGIGYILRKRLAEAKIGSAEAKAQQIADDAKRLLDIQRSTEPEKRGDDADS